MESQKLLGLATGPWELTSGHEEEPSYTHRIVPPPGRRLVPLINSLCSPSVPCLVWVLSDVPQGLSVSHDPRQFQMLLFSFCSGHKSKHYDKVPTVILITTTPSKLVHENMKLKQLEWFHTNNSDKAAKTNICRRFNVFKGSGNSLLFLCSFIWFLTQ